MKKRRLYILLSAAMLAALACLAAFTVSASAEKQTIYVQLVTGQVVPVVVDVPPGTPLNQIPLPGPPVPAPTLTQPQTETQPTETSPTTEPKPKSKGGEPQKRTGSKKRAPKRKHRLRRKEATQAPAEDKGSRPRHRRRHRTPLRNPDGSPTPQNPGFIDALPGPS